MGGGFFQETTINPWRFSSKRIDSETGFVYFGRRYYNPSTGRSTGFGEFMKWLAREEGLSVLDLGPTSPANITFFIGLGHRFHQEDVLRLASDKSLIVPSSEGQKTVDVDRFLRENLPLVFFSTNIYFHSVSTS